ncbi:MAG: cytochrome d ubiquinol oxidase subunit II [Gammaproteobacteria bacterium]|nr:cytochrome d ubiquinol oxidase subunit II [Gammaproteobacteria bacterium]
MIDVLAVACIFVIGFCVLMYVLLDGFDLGIGILFPFFPGRHARDIMVSTVLPVWDGNQTWLVLGGAFLYGAFPQAFSLLLPALYMPIFVMVMSLLFRGITFEFRLKAKKSLPWWDALFCVSSTLVCFCQGLVLGTFVKGFQLGSEPNTLSYELFTPFNISCGFALLFGYALLGATWIIGKTTGELQARMYHAAKICLLVVTLFLMIISLWTPFVDDSIRAIWFNPNYIYKLAMLPLVTGLMILYFGYALYKRAEYILFWLAIGIFVCAYLGFGISTFPYLIPHVLTIWQVVAPESTVLFMLFGALLLLPMLVGYTSYSYYVFRGKVTETIGY